jgi:putative acyl-CoA dehydrogenase
MTAVATEAMECLGGNGYVEESPLARLYREAPLNGIWEGSANVICLDALRAFARSPVATASLEAEVAAGGDPRLTERFRGAVRLLADAEGAASQARAIVETVALCVQGSLMRRHASAAAADAFCVSRLGTEGRRAFGALALGSAELAALVERARLRA